MQRLTESEFSNFAENIINSVAQTIETEDSEGLLDIDLYEDNIINIHTPQGQYVINKHTAAREIWLASPISGAYHFAYNSTQNKWLDQKNNDLLKIIEQELKTLLPSLNLQSL